MGKILVFYWAQFAGCILFLGRMDLMGSSGSTNTKGSDQSIEIIPMINSHLKILYFACRM